MDEKRLTHLQQLEAESIHIIREVAAEFSNPVMMYSIGKDSSVMKRSNAQGAIEHTVERNALWHALTPQLFPLMLLKNSLERALSEGAEITDEASALEFCGYHPQIVSGRADNIKVTRPEDLALAEFYLTRNLENQTIV